jgi:beta-lactamase class D
MAAHSGESFDSAWNRDRAMREFKAGAANWRWQVLAARDGTGWYWHATSYGNNQIVGWSGRTWADRGLADQSMRVVQNNAGAAHCP